MPSISIVVPSKNEEGNISRLIQGIYDALIHYVPELKYEAIVVDDSTDRTAMIARSLGARVIKGQGKGLGQSIIDGINASKNDIVVVMDADGSHDPKAIPSLLKPILQQGADLVIGSRYVKGGDYSNWALNRKIKSLIGVKLMQLVTGVRDSNSGFFCFRKSIVDTSKLSGRTWKIMLEILFKGNWISKLEVPITFGDRTSGESKRSTKQVARDGMNLIKLVGYKYGRFIKFVLVGGVGNIWHYSLLWVLTEYVGMWYGLSLAIAMLAAMTSNYFVNHYWSFRDRREANRNLAVGWLKFCGQSAVGDYGIAYPLTLLLTSVFGVWYMLSSFLASGVAVFFKYMLSKRFIWRKEGRRASDADYEWVSFFKGLPWQRYWKRIIAGIAKEFAEYPDGDAGSVLDCGCGSSPLGLMINHRDYIAVDPNRNKMEYMKAKNLSKCLFIHGTLDTVTFTEDSYFDTVLFIEVIEHLVDMDEARFNLMKIHKLLKPNGKLVVATPNFGGFMGRAMDNLYGIFQKGAYKEEHRLKFDLPSLKQLCQECGFRYVKSKIPSGADMVCLFQKS